MLLLSFFPPLGHLKCNWLSREGCTTAGLKKILLSYTLTSHFFFPWNKHTLFTFFFFFTKKVIKIFQKYSVICKIGIFKTNLFQNRFYTQHLQSAASSSCGGRLWTVCDWICNSFCRLRKLQAKEREWWVQRLSSCLEQVGSNLIPLHLEGLSKIKVTVNMNSRRLPAVLHFEPIQWSITDGCNRNLSLSVLEAGGVVQFWWGLHSGPHTAIFSFSYLEAHT